MAGTVTGLVTFGTQSGQIPLSNLDTNFSAFKSSVNSANTFNNYFVDTGTTNVLAISIPSVTTYSLVDGLQICVKVANSNTGAATLNINSTSDVSIVNPDGSSLIENQILANSIISVVYNNLKWRLVSNALQGTALVSTTTSGVPAVFQASSADNYSYLNLNGYAGSYVKFFWHSSAKWLVGAPVGGAVGGDMAFYNYTTSANSLTIKGSTGNIGIGTDSPGKKLDVVGDIQLTNNSGIYWKNVAGTSVGIVSLDTSDNVVNGLGSAFKGSYSWNSNNIQLMTLSQGGTVTTNSSLSLQGGASGLGLSSGNVSQPMCFYIGQFGVNASEKARIDSNGIFMMGKTASSPSSVGFQVQGNGELFITKSGSTSAEASYYLYSAGAGLYRFYVGMDGTVNATNTAIAAISDQRLKENIRDLDVGLDAVMALKPRKFDWKPGKGKDIKDDRGFVAQEFEQVFPDLVSEWKDPPPEGESPYKSVKQDLIPILVKAIQEQQAMIEDLLERVEALESNKA